jgi:hypothetical protein
MMKNIIIRFFYEKLLSLIFIFFIILHYAMCNITNAFLIQKFKFVFYYIRKFCFGILSVVFVACLQRIEKYALKTKEEIFNTYITFSKKYLL